MNADMLYISLNDLDDDLIMRSEDDSSFHRPFRLSRRLSIGVIAAVLMALMMTAGVASVIYSDNIQHWFANYWELITGHQMSVSHSALIDHLSQDIGISKTIDNVTVTVDSATVGDDSFFLLVKMSGPELSERYGYGFDKLYLDISPEPWGDSAGIGSFSCNFKGISENGDGVFLFEHDYFTSGNISPEPFEVSLSLGDFSEYMAGDNKVIASGPWDFNFIITPNMLDDIITLPDTEVTAFDNSADEYTEVPVVITDIKINSTSLRFSHNHKNGTLTVDSHIYAVLDNGHEIGISGGSGTVDGDILNNIYRWEIPVDPMELSAIKIGKTTISIP